MLSFLLGAPSPTPGNGADPPSWTDKLEAWSTLGGAIVALLAAAATIWLLIHQIGETRRARAEAQQERTDAAEDRELARQDRELAAAERRDAEKAQARTVILTTEVGSLRDGDRRLRGSLVNFGPEPVLNAAVEFTDVSDEEAVALNEGPGDGSSMVFVTGSGVLKPGERLDFDAELSEELFGGLDEDDYRRIMRIVDLRVTFADLGGRRWVRAAGDSEPTRLFLPFQNERSS